MYSKNDYRYYLENQLMHSDDFLAHYGVKGMKWKKHLKRAAIPKDLTFERRTDPFNNNVKNYRLDFDKHYGKDGKREWSEGVGIRTLHDKKTGERKITAYNTRRVKLDKDGYAKTESKNLGRLSKSRAEDGVEYTVDLTSRKNRKKLKKRELGRTIGEGAYWSGYYSKKAISKKK